MALIFRINENNINSIVEQVTDCVDQLGICILTGCGNFYTDLRSANNKRDFTNPAQEESTYMLTFKKGDRIPTTVKGFIDMFYEQRKTDDMAANSQTLNTQQNVLKARQKVEVKAEPDKTKVEDKNEFNKKK